MFVSYLAIASLLLSLRVQSTDGAFAAMSVDIGSQYLKMGLVKPGVPLEIVLNKESQRKTANLIAFHNGERLFGESALQMSYKNPERVFPYVTDLLGKQFDNPVVQDYVKQYPYLNLTKDPERGTVVFNTKNGESYSVETLVGMILWNAREQVVVFGKTPVKDVVVTAPAYFNQAEREALVNAVEIAGLNLLQVISDGAAAAVNYGFTRRKDITEKAQYVVIYDIGASKTVASVIELKLAKENGSKSLDPVISVIGVGYNRLLGGHDLTVRVRDFLAAEFTKQHKTTQPISGNLRAMAKLLKEAERVKHVLSANTQTYAQVESAFEDKDFRFLMTRDMLNDLLKEFETDYITPVMDALRMSELNVDNIDQVILFGAGTRVPRIQDLLRDYFKGKEPNKFLNTDEASALGALYQAAFHSKGFKVKKIALHELQIYPVQINFETLSNDEEKTLRNVDRTIFSYKSHYPTNRKIMTFTSHQDDFIINLHYGKLDHLSSEQLTQFGGSNITDVEIRGVTEAFKSASEEEHVFKGVKAFFSVDYFGIIRAEGAEAIIEQPLVKKNSTLGAIVDTIGSFFGSKDSEPTEGLKEDPSAVEPPVSQSGDDADKNENEGQTPPETEKEPETPKETPPESSEDKKTEETPVNATETDSAKNETKPAEKPKIVKAKLNVGFYQAHLDLDKSQIEESKKVLSVFERAEKQKAEREAAHNDLEARVYELQDRLSSEDFVKFVREEELKNLTELVQAASKWLDEDVDPNTKTEEFIEKKVPIDVIFTVIQKRIRDDEERPKLVERFNEVLTKLKDMVDKLKTESPNILEPKAYNKSEQLIKQNEEFISTRLPKSPIQDDGFNEETRMKIEKMERVGSDLFNKFTRKVKELEKAAKKAAEEAAAAANASKAENATETVEGTQEEAKPADQPETEGQTPEENVEQTGETPENSEEKVVGEEKTEDQKVSHDEV